MPTTPKTVVTRQTHNSIKIVDDGVVPEMTEKDRELKAYYDDKAKVEKAMSY